MKQNSLFREVDERILCVVLITGQIHVCLDGLTSTVSELPATEVGIDNFRDKSRLTTHSDIQLFVGQMDYITFNSTDTSVVSEASLAANACMLFGENIDTSRCCMHVCASCDDIYGHN